MASKFKVGDLVWAKMKGFCAWPGKIIEPKTEVKRPANKKPHQFVFFFGSENYAWIAEDSIYGYWEGKQKFSLSSRIPKGFKEAVEAIEDAAMANPEAATRTSELPSIDEELAQIFPNRNVSPHKDYSREPLTGRKSTDSSSKKGTNKKVNRSVWETLKAEGLAGDSEVRDNKETNSTVRKGPVKRASLPPQPTVMKKAKPSSAKAVGTGMPDSQRGSETLNSGLHLQASRSPQTGLGRQDLVTEDEYTFNDKIEENLLLKAPPKAVIPTPLRIGFLGLGIMGQGMVMNLLRSGHEVTVWNRTGSKCREFVKAGALRGANPADVVQSCDITFTCVADSIAVRDVVFGNSGVLQGISKGKCYVEMSTVDEETMQDVADAVMSRGGSFLEAPVCGSRVPALEGQLIILTSGDRKLYDDCYSCFEAMGRKSFYLGNEVGTATRMKLLNNMILGSVMASLAEGLALAEKVGLDQEDVAEVLSLGSLSCPTVNHKSQAILNGKYDPHFPLQHQQKDLRLALQLGDSVEQPLYIAAAANELFKKARRLGYGDSDISAVYRATSA